MDRAGLENLRTARLERGSRQIASHALGPATASIALGRGASASADRGRLRAGRVRLVGPCAVVATPPAYRNSCQKRWARTKSLPRTWSVRRVHRRDVDTAAEWFSPKMGVAVTAPDLGGLDMSLVGARLLGTKEGPLVQYIYEDGEGGALFADPRQTPGKPAHRTASGRGLPGSGCGLLEHAEHRLRAYRQEQRWVRSNRLLPTSQRRSDKLRDTSPLTKHAARRPGRRFFA